MDKSSNIQEFGFSEMYECQTNPDRFKDRFGLFVQFSTRNTNKIEPYKGGELMGVSTICSTISSDRCDEWHDKYKKKDNGAYKFETKTLAVGTKEYDQELEMPYIHTYKYDVRKKIESDKFDSSKDYYPRYVRGEWLW